MSTTKLRKFDTAETLTPAELELVNWNFWAIEQALNSIGATTPESTGSAPSSVPIKHSALLDLTADDHLQYFLITNVKAYGAIGDGIVDDTIAIQAAIDAASNGGTIFFPPGRYRLATGVAGSPTLNITGRTALRLLAGGGHTVLLHDRSGADECLLIRDSRMIVIDGLGFQAAQGTGHAIAISNDVIVGAETGSVELRNVYVDTDSVGGAGIFIDTASNIVIYHPMITDEAKFKPQVVTNPDSPRAQWGIRILGGASNVSIIQPTIRGCAQEGILASNVGGTVFNISVLGGDIVGNAMVSGHGILFFGTDKCGIYHVHCNQTSGVVGAFDLKVENSTRFVLAGGNYDRGITFVNSTTTRLFSSAAAIEIESAVDKVAQLDTSLLTAGTSIFQFPAEPVGTRQLMTVTAIQNIFSKFFSTGCHGGVDGTTGKFHFSNFASQSNKLIFDLTTAIGNNILKVNSTVARTYTSPDRTGTLIIASAPDTTKGDILVNDGSSLIRLPVGVNNDVLTADSLQAAGIKWAAPAGGGGTHNLLSVTHPDTVVATVVRGDLIVGNSTPAWARFAIGAANRVLRVNSAGTDLEYALLSSSNIADRTRTEFLPMQNFSNSQSATAVQRGTHPNRYSAWEMLNTSVVGGRGVTTVWQVPQDIVQINNFVIYAAPAAAAGSGGVVWEITYIRRVVGDSMIATGTTDQSIGSSPGVADQLFSTSLTPSALAPIAGELLRIVVTRRVDNANDTSTQTIEFIGLEINYTADM